jgi:hypothetical protein
LEALETEALQLPAQDRERLIERNRFEMPRRTGRAALSPPAIPFDAAIRACAG